MTPNLHSHLESSILVRLSRWTQRRRLIALLLWVAVLAGTVFAAARIGSDFHDDQSLPGTQSQQLVDLLDAHAPAQAGDSIQVVFASPNGIVTRDMRQRVGRVLSDVAKLPHVVAVDDPYQESGAISSDGTVGYATVTLDDQAADYEIVGHTAAVTEPGTVKAK